MEAKVELKLTEYTAWSRQWKWTRLGGIYNIKIYSDLSLVSSYPSQIILYKSLHTYWWSILESTIWEISYLGFLSIITSIGASYVSLEKELDIVCLNIDICKTR